MKIREIIDVLIELEQLERAIQDAEGEGLVVPIGKEIIKLKPSSTEINLIKGKYLKKLKDVKSELMSILNEIESKTK